MDRIKVKVVCDWDSDYNISNIFRDIWYNDEISQKIDLVYTDIYDYLIILNKYKSQIQCPIENRIAFVMEPSWSQNWDRNLGSYVSKIYSHINFDQKCQFNPSVMTTHLFPKPINIGEIQYIKNNINTISNTKYDKTKKLSIIVSNISGYKRYNFVQKLLNSDLEFDMYGRGWNITDRRYKGYIENKLDAIKDYQFSICMENSVEDGYITEKFIDSILCETVPIYYGSNNVENWYGNNCFEYIDVEDDSIDRIKEIISNDKVYNFNKAKDFYLNINNPFNILLKYINNNDTNNNT